MKKSLFLLCSLFLSIVAQAQMFTSSPSPLQESSEDVVITFHAEKSGVAGLQNLPASTNLYAHIGCSTNLAPDEWKYVHSKWGKVDPDYQFQFVTLNTYELYIGNLREYFGVTNPDEHITRVCIIARNATGTVQTTDQFIDVLGEGFQMSFSNDAKESVLIAATSVKFNVGTSRAADITLKLNGETVASANGAQTLSKTIAMNNPGSYVVTATATAGGETLTETASFIYVQAAQQANYPGGVPKMGAVKNNDGTVTFCLAAPQKSSVILVPSWDNYQALDKNVMKYQDYNGNRYFWVTVSGLDNTTAYPYYYVVDGNIKVADPYAHLVLDCYSDKWLKSNVYPDRPAYPYELFDDRMLAVYQGNIDDYNWQVQNFTIPSHENLTIYELLFRDFTGTSGKDDGTIKDAIAKIPYLKKLGINAVELMPIMEFNGNNSWGYNTNFYLAPDKAYGSPKEYKQFIDLCHQNGIAVILDIVFNQSDGLHPWYQMYSKTANPFYNAVAPHDYSVLNDWKQENPLVQQQWEDAIKYWMTAYKVDGFRFDLVKGLGTSYPNGTEAYNASRVAVTKRLHNVIKSVNPNAIHINEHLAGAQEENEMGADGQLNWSNINWASCQFAMGYLDGMGDMTKFYAPKNGRTIGTTVAYAESHDEERMGYKQSQWGSSTVKGKVPESMRRLGSVAAQMLMCPGSKMIWQFGEVGADQTTKDANGGNDTSCKKVLWNYLDDPDRLGLHDNYAELCNIRTNNPALFKNDAEVTYTSFGNTSNGRSIRLKAGNQELVTLINPGVTGSANISANVQLINASSYQVMSKSYGFDNPSVQVSGGQVTVNVPAHSYIVIGTGNLTGIDTVEADLNAATARAYSIDGRIAIAGDYTNATAYTISGALAPIGKTVAPGIYVVVIDGNATKVVVK